MTKDIFQLAEYEKSKKLTRIIKMQLRFGHDSARTIIASHLYQASYEVNGNQKTEEILDRFCLSIFGSSYQEVMESYDRYLG